MTTLRVVPAQGQPFDYELSGERLVIGRSRRADLVIADGYLSRRHSEIYREGDRLMVRDLGSVNGTRVNGRQIDRPTPLAPGDQVEMSATVVTVGGGLAAAAPGAEALTGTVFLPASELALRYVAESGPEAEKDDLRRQSERLRILNEVHQVLAGSIERDELLELVLDRAFDHLRPQQGAVFLADGEGGWRRVAGRRTGSEDDYLYSRTLVEEVADKGMAALVLDAASDSRFGAAESIMSSGVRSLIAAPFLCPEGSLGMIALNSTLNVRQFDEEDLELLSSLASVAALRLWSLSLADEAAERRRMAAELELARRIQTALLPVELPAVAGYELEALNVPSRVVSGDFYQLLPRAGGGECVAFLADVSGKGMAASILTATIEALAAVPIREGLPPEQVFGILGRLLEERTPPEKFATAFLAALELETGRLRYANAGHNPALLVRGDGEVELLERTGLPLGLLAAATYEAASVELAPGDLVVVYTDGITEAANPDGEEYGHERLAAVCRDRRQGSLGELVAAVEQDVEGFIAGEPFADDRTLIALRRRA